MLKVQAQQISSKWSLHIKLILRVAFTILISLLFANSKICGSSSCLMAAFVSATHITYGIFGFVTAVLVYFIKGQIINSLVPVISMLMIIIVKIVVSEIMNKKLNAIAYGIITAIIYTLAGVTIVMYTTTLASATFLAICDGIFCGCATYFFILAKEAFLNEQKLVFTGKYGASTAVVYVLGVTALCTINISIFNLGRIFAFIVILLALKRFKYVGGVICSSLATCGMALYSPTFAASSLLICVSALISGAFSEFGNIMISVFFIATNSIGAIILGVTPETAQLIVDAIIASVVFILIPDNALSMVIGANPIVQSEQKIAKLVSSRLNFAASTIADVKKSIAKVSLKLEEKNDSKDLATMVCDEVCSDCKNNLYCWENDFDKTYEQFNEISKTILAKKVLTINDIPKNMQSCFRKNQIIDNYNNFYIQKNQESFVKAKFKDMREILFEQFDVIEDTLNQMSTETSNGYQLDSALSKQLNTFFLDFGAENPNVCAFYDTYNHIYIEAFYTNKLKLTNEELAIELSDIVDRDIEIPILHTVNNNTKLCAMEKPSYKLNINTLQKSSTNCQPSGDTCEYFYDGHGNAYFIISDGMGTGKKAAIDSMLAVNLLIRLLKAGFGYEATFKIVNSSVLSKSNDESFATIDIACINLYTGTLEILKLGASATFVRSSKKFFAFQTTSLPLGILHDTVVDKKSTVLKENDMVLMVSDGLDDSIYPFIQKEMTKKTTTDPTELTNSIINQIIRINPDAKKDDISILAFKLEKLD